MPATALTSNRNAFDVPAFATLDQSAGEPTSRKAVATALLLNAAAALLLVATFGAVKTKLVHQPAVFAMVDPVDFPLPPKIVPQALLAGGGGGQKGAAPASQGNPPAFAVLQLDPPKVLPAIAPRLEIPVTVDVDPNLRMAHADVPNFGMPNSPLVGVNLGDGKGTGIGGGDGPGLGPGKNGNTGNLVRNVGGGVSAPVPLFTPEPEFSEEARRQKASGNVLVSLQVDELGRTSHVRILRGLGMGLDEKAIAAVQLYRFKPARENGRPVRVEMNVDVNFQIY